MFNKICFKPCYSVTTIAPDQVFILSERESIWLSDRFSYLVASLINGDHTSDEIIEAIQYQMLQELASQDNSNLFQQALDVSLKAQSALFQMQKKGYLIEETQTLPSNLISFCHHLNVPPNQAYQRLKSTKVMIKSLSCPARENLSANLQSLNISLVHESDLETPDLIVVLTNDYLNPDLKEINQKSLHSQVPWMLVKPVGTMIWLGPIFDTPHTACWQCLARRLQDNRPIESFIQRTHNQSVTPLNPQEFLSSTLHTACSMAATEIFKWIVLEGNQALSNTLITYDTLTRQSQEHAVVKRPQCSSCGNITKGLKNKPLPVVLGHRQKTFTADGGHRCYSPQETLRKYQHHISPITGVVRELSEIPGNELTHNYVAKHHFLSTFDDLNSLRQNLGGRSAGKGKTASQAMASGFCEAIERYSGVFQGNEIREKGSFQQMGDKAIHPNTCMNFSQQQYQQRKQWNESSPGWFQRVPEPFDESREIEWTPIWSLTHQAFKYLPTAYCYFGYQPPYQPDCWADSNGCAAGNNLEEAILQGFMELVERDAVALWWYNYLRKPPVDLDSFEDSYFHSLKQYYQSIDRELWVLDITSDLNIPVFAAISRRRDSSSDYEAEDIVLGYGAHFDAKIAISRALTEANQILPNVLWKNTNGRIQYPPSADRLAIDWWQTATLTNKPYLVPGDRLATKVKSDYPQIASNDLLDDIKLCQKIVEEKGMEMLVLDQTRPDIGLRVAKVVVPGMRHMWRRLATGRLYDVPVQQRWLSESLTEEQLNSFPMWM